MVVSLVSKGEKPVQRYGDWRIFPLYFDTIIYFTFYLFSPDFVSQILLSAFEVCLITTILQENNFCYDNQSCEPVGSVINL